MELVCVLEDVWWGKEDISGVVGASEDVRKEKRTFRGWVAYWRMHGNGMRTFRSWFVHWMMCGDERRTFRGWLEDVRKRKEDISEMVGAVEDVWE